MEEIVNNIRRQEWQSLVFNENRVTVENSDLVLASQENGIITINLLSNYEDEDGIIQYKYRYNSLHSFKFERGVNPFQFLTQDFKVKFYTQLNSVFNFRENHISSIVLNNGFQGYEQQGNSVRFNPQTLNEIVNNYSEIFDIGSSYSRKIVTHKSNEFARTYFGIERERKTLTTPGEFSFLISRFCLETKRSKNDFTKYLNTNDITDIQEFTESLINNEVFNNDFLQRLNDYFIKERLSDIIKLGKEILSLKSDSIRTITAKNIISKVESDGRRIRQFENVWQKYFEKYLLYLIFSYQKIYPKIELNVDLRKKYPDFIGINHYGGVDVIEIKTHLKNALTKDKSHDNYAFSAELSKAIIQTINYMDALIHEKIRNRAEREDIKGKILEGNIYRPRGIIIISSYKYLVSGVKETDVEFEKVKRDFTKLRNGLNNIQILTFDEVINMADNYKNNFVE